MTLDDLPDFSEVKRRMQEIGNFSVQQAGLYRADGMDLDEDEKTDFELQQESEFNLDDEDDIPEFLRDENVEMYSGSDEGDELPERDDNSDPDIDDSDEIGI